MQANNYQILIVLIATITTIIDMDTYIRNEYQSKNPLNHTDSNHHVLYVIDKVTAYVMIKNIVINIIIV